MRRIKTFSAGLLVLLLLGLFQNCSPEMLSQMRGKGFGGEAYEGRDITSGPDQPGDPVNPGIPPGDGNTPGLRVYTCSSNEAVDFGISSVSFIPQGSVLKNFKAEFTQGSSVTRESVVWEDGVYLLDIELLENFVLESIALDDQLTFANLRIVTPNAEIFKLRVECWR